MRRVRVERVTLLKAAGQRDLLGVFVLHRQPLERAVLPNDIYGVPVGEVRHRQARYPGERSPVVERGGELRAGLDQEALRLFVPLALGYVVTAPAIRVGAPCS